jgi:hypothetical protein
MLHDVLRSVATKPPMRNGQSSFASVVKMGYEDIKTLRDKGYSFKCIMDELIRAGFFPDGSDSKYLCQAYAREKRKQEALARSKSNVHINRVVNLN